MVKNQQNNIHSLQEWNRQEARNLKFSIKLSEENVYSEDRCDGEPLLLSY